MILFEGGLSLLGGPVRPHGSHIPKTTTGHIKHLIAAIEVAATSCRRYKSGHI